MKNFKRNLFIWSAIVILAIVVAIIGDIVLIAAIKSEPHNMTAFWIGCAMLISGCAITIPSIGMLSSVAYKNREAKQKAINMKHEAEILPFAKARLKEKFGYDDSNSTIFCKDGKVYCRPITEVKEIVMEITITKEE